MMTSTTLAPMTDAQYIAQFPTCAAAVGRFHWLRKRKNVGVYAAELKRMRRLGLVKRRCGEKKSRALAGWDWGVPWWQALNPLAYAWEEITDGAAQVQDLWSQRAGGNASATPTAASLPAAPRASMPDIDPEDPFGDEKTGPPAWVVPAVVGGGILLVALALAARRGR